MIANDDSERHTPPIRVLVANKSPVMSEIVRHAVEQHSDLALVDFAGDLAELPQRIGDLTDVLVIGASHAYLPPEICRHLWQSFPSLKVLVLTPSGDAAVVYWLRVAQKRLKTVSAETLIGSIRRVHSLDFTET